MLFLNLTDRSCNQAGVLLRDNMDLNILKRGFLDPICRGSTMFPHQEQRQMQIVKKRRENSNQNFASLLAKPGSQC